MICPVNLGLLGATGDLARNLQRQWWAGTEWAAVFLPFPWCFQERPPSFKKNPHCFINPPGACLDSSRVSSCLCVRHHTHSTHSRSYLNALCYPPLLHSHRNCSAQWLLAVTVTFYFRILQTPEMVERTRLPYGGVGLCFCLSHALSPPSRERRLLLASAFLRALPLNQN